MKILTNDLLAGRKTKVLIMELFLFRLGVRNATARTHAVTRAARPLDITSVIFADAILSLWRGKVKNEFVYFVVTTILSKIWIQVILK